MDRKMLDDFITLHEKEIFEHDEPERRWSDLTSEEKKRPSTLNCSITTSSMGEFDEFLKRLSEEEDDV